MPNQYGLDAAALLTKTEKSIVELLHDAQHCNALVELLDKVQMTRNCVLTYLTRQLDDERESIVKNIGFGGDGDSDRRRVSFSFENNVHNISNNRNVTLSEVVEKLGSMMEENKAMKAANGGSTSTAATTTILSDDDTTTRVSYFQTRSTDDTMLFRLIVILQLCSVRIFVVTRYTVFLFLCL